MKIKVKSSDIPGLISFLGENLGPMFNSRYAQRLHIGVDAYYKYNVVALGEQWVIYMENGYIDGVYFVLDFDGRALKKAERTLLYLKYRQHD